MYRDTEVLENNNINPVAQQDIEQDILETTAEMTQPPRENPPTIPDGEISKSLQNTDAEVELLINMDK